eukprot:TRINITY_DN16727_c0_g1_i2.p1 TRINITY_DN16727_c0_g1~~TRINITY_DN16727_c0_g1_i2.p1  ORF type:complete len:4009 (-),score=688.03 TRINITY_DN16727_c0_g1_i2:80-12106(-)
MVLRRLPRPSLALAIALLDACLSVAGSDGGALPAELGRGETDAFRFWSDLAASALNVDGNGRQLQAAGSDDCIFTLRGDGEPLNAGASNNRRCGSTFGASDVASAMCVGAGADGSLYLPESAVRDRCAKDSSCVGYGRFKAPVFVKVQGANSLFGLEQLCRAMTGRLASVTTASEQAAAVAACAGSDACYLGLQWETGAWRWMDGAAYNSSLGCCAPSNTSYHAFRAGHHVDGKAAPCVALLDGQWEGIACPTGTTIGARNVAGICRIEESFRPVTAVSELGSTPSNWETYEVANRGACSMYPVTYYRALLPPGHLLTLQMKGGRTLRGQDGSLYPPIPAELAVSAGEPIDRISITVPIGSLFDVGITATPGLRIVPDWVVRVMANAGACVYGTGVGMGLDAVDRPAASPEGLTLGDARGNESIHTLAGLSVTLLKAGRYKLCYSDDGSFSPGHADVVDVVLDGRGVEDPCTGEDCLAQRRYRCYSRIGEVGPAGVCSLPVSGFMTSPGRFSWSARLGQKFGGDGKPQALRQDGSWILFRPRTNCDYRVLLVLRPSGVSVTQCQDLVFFDYNCELEFVSDGNSCRCVKLGQACDWQGGTANMHLYKYQRNKYGSACPPPNGTYAPDPSAFEINGSAAGGGLTLPATADRLTLPRTQAVAMKTEAATVAVCYCQPDSPLGCTDLSEYWQQIGILHLFVAHVMLPSVEKCIDDDLSGFMAPLPFILCVRCPPGGCDFNVAGSRIRFSESPTKVDSPTWATGHSCHGANTSELLMPRGPDAEEADGGLRSDWKRFAPLGPERGFSLPTWPQSKRPGTDLDVCLCLGSCNLTTSWFKVAQLDVIHPQILVASELPSRPHTWLPSIVGKPGRLALDASTISYGHARGILGLRTGSAVRLRAFDTAGELTTAEACAKEGGRPGDIDRNDVLLGSLRGQRLVFDNLSASYNLTLQFVSTPVICYCASVRADDVSRCTDLPWIPVGMIAIGGPDSGQLWMLPTHRKVRFQYTGRELRRTDRLRLIWLDELGSGRSCENPPLEEFCPTIGAHSHRICLRQGATQFGDYPTQILAYDSINCDDMNANCDKTFVESLEVDGDDLNVRFTKPPTNPSGLGPLGLAPGDTLVIEGGTEGVVCDSVACTPEILLSARGRASRLGLQAYYKFEDLDMTVRPATVFAEDSVEYGLGRAELVIINGSSWRLADPNASCSDTCAAVPNGVCDLASSRFQFVKDFEALKLVVAGLTPSLPKTTGGTFAGWNFAGSGYGGYAYPVSVDESNPAFPMYWEKSRLDCPTCHYEYLFQNVGRTSSCEASKSPECVYPHNCHRLCFCPEIVPGNEHMGFKEVSGYGGTKALRVGQPGGADLSALRTGLALDVARPWSVLLWMRTNRKVNSWRTICGFTNGPYGNRNLEKGEVEFGIAGTGALVDGSLFLRQAGPFRATANDVIQADDPDMVAANWSQDEWTHVGVVYTGDGSGYLRFYINGSLSYERSGIRLQPSLTPMYCGGGAGRPWPSGANAEWIDLDELRYYSMALSSQEVAAVSRVSPTGTEDAGVSANAAIGVRVDSGSDARTFNIPSLVPRWGPNAQDVKFRVNGAPDGGRWRRTNRGVTRAEIITPREGWARVCWNRDGEYVEAGKIRFKSPVAFGNVGVYMTATQYGVSWPFVLSFNTQPLISDVGRRYELAGGLTRLEIVVLDRSYFDVYSSTPDGYELRTAYPDEDGMEDASQVICGRIFREMWSDDEELGFPLPKGCFYYEIGANMREIVILFDERNGIRGGKNYQLVMNCYIASSFNPSYEVVMITAVDDYNNRRYESLELGHGYANSGGKLRGSKNEPQFRFNDGLVIGGGDQERQLLTMTETSALTIDMRGPEWQTGKVKRGCHLNIWLWPLTAWKLPEVCWDVLDSRWRPGDLKAKCSVVFGAFRRCGRLKECWTKSVVFLGPQNKIEVTFGEDMNDLYGEMIYRLEFWGIIPHARGVPPSRFAAELQTPDRRKVRYSIIGGPFIWAETSPRETTLGRLLTDGKDSMPFRGEDAFLVYMKVMLALPLRGAETSRNEPWGRPDSSLSVLAPEGFECLGVAKAPPTLGAEVDAIGAVGGYARAGLANSTHKSPTGFGTPECTDTYPLCRDPTRGWKLAGRYCNYTLPEKSIIPDRSSMVIGVYVKPTNTSMPVVDPRNEWRISVESPGEHNTTKVGYSFRFYRTGQGGVPVLGIIDKRAFIQPSDFSLARRSTDGEEGARRLTDLESRQATNDLRVFAPIGLKVTNGGGIDVEAPQAFHFGERCHAEHLDDAYYAEGLSTRLYPLPGIVKCEGARTIIDDWENSPQPRNVARVWVAGNLFSDRVYGFKVKVANPSLDDLQAYPAGVWGIRTRGDAGEAMESTQGSVPAAAGAASSFGSWQLRNRSLRVVDTLGQTGKFHPDGAVAIGFSPRLPSSVNGDMANATVLMRLPQNLSGAELRIIAPEGFKWQAATVLRRPYPPWNANVTADLPVLPDVSQSAGNYLRFQLGDFVQGELYGFTVKILVPDHSPLVSAQSFFVDLTPPGKGFESGIAATVKSESVRAIVDARVMSSSRIPGANVSLMLAARLSTAVTYPGRFTISVPPNYTLPRKCQILPWPGQVTWKEEPLGKAECEWSNETRLITIRPTPFAPLQVGPLRWQVPATNPVVEANHSEVSDCGHALCWNFATFDADGLAGGNGDLLDLNQTVVGLDIAEPMYDGALLAFRPSVRDDRPGRPSRLVFRFRMKGPKQLAVAEAIVGGQLPPLPPGHLQLTGPAGFQFKERCLTDVEVRRNVIFGDEWVAYNIWGAYAWERSALIVSCEGNGRRASIGIAAGLRNDRSYAVSIAVRNPLVVPQVNVWTLSMHDHFSQEIPSFDIWTFADLKLVARSVHSGPSCYAGQCVGAGVGVAVPIRFNFRVRSVVKTGGELHITAPSEFAFEENQEAARTEGDLPTECTVFQYWDGNLSKTPEMWRVSDRACFVVDRGSPLEGTGTGDKRTLRMRLKYLFNEFEDRDPRELRPESIFQLVAYVIPPPSSRPAALWTVETRDEKGGALDIGSLMGYEVKKVLLQLRHSNEEYNWFANERRGVQVAGTKPVPDFVIQFSLPEIAGLQDNIIIKAPPGFNFGNSTTGCIPMALLLPEKLATPNATEPAECDGSVITWRLHKLRSTLQSAVDIRLLLNITNAREPAPPGTNYWILEHYSNMGNLVAAAMVPSWPIIPTLTGLRSELTGALRAAGAVSTLSFSFENVLQASEVLITALEPEGFDFTGVIARGVIAGVASPSYQVLLAKGPVLRVVMRLPAESNSTLDVIGVRLPVLPVATRWRISTWELSSAEEDYGKAYIRDEATFVGFRVPGRIVIEVGYAKTPVKTRSGTIIFSAAVLDGLESNVSLPLDISTDLYAGDVVFVELFGADEKGFKIVGNATMEPGSPGGPLTPAALPLEAVRDRSVAATLNSSVPAGSTFFVRLPCLTPKDRSAFALERWQIEVYRGGYSTKTFVATNDMQAFPLQVSTMLPTEPPPSTTHSPPLVTIEVLFVLDPLDTGANAMVITAPPGFAFAPDCMAVEANENVSSDAMCMALPVRKKGDRSRAQLDCLGQGRGKGGGPPGPSSYSIDDGWPADGKFECLRKEPVTVLVETPRDTPANVDNVWFVESIHIGSEDDALGRTEFDGFPLQRMPCEVTYSSCAAVPVEIGIYFQTLIDIPAGGFVRIQAPKSLGAFNCGDEALGFVRPLTLGEISNCEEGREKYSVRLQVNRTVYAGLHSVAIPGRTPSQEPDPKQNVFELYLEGPDGNNLDVALQVPGEDLVYGLRANAWPVRWTLGKDKSQPIKVALPVEVIDNADIAIHGFLVSLPREPPMKLSSTRTLRLSTDYGVQLPRQQLTFDKEDSTVLIRLASGDKLDMDLYLIHLEVEYPEVPPRFNLWRVALCGARMLNSTAKSQGCTISGNRREDRGEAVLSVFSLAGFYPSTAFAARIVVGGTPMRASLAFGSRLLLATLLSLSVLSLFSPVPSRASADVRT